MSFNSLKFDYSTRNFICDKLGKVYVFSEDELFDVYCNKFNCSFCRPKLKYMLFLDVLSNVYSFKLFKHFVITFPGTEKRKSISFVDSYSYMSKCWKSFLVCLTRKYGYIDYILFPRSQKDGYCHYHILLSKHISWYWLNKKRKSYGLGFMSIQKNKDTADYLLLDFWKDNEYVIPASYRHFRSSRSIIFNNFRKQGFNYHKFPFDIPMSDIEFYIKSQYNPDFNLWFYRVKSYIDSKLVKFPNVFF